ncbi:hypothetical protein AMIS_18670 [Actinoplanes missouriensis 431]|uniref:Uncharacterized protein n=1 Tax=Actinoplanes missouriensis (strain ATCC 14538 / DSM 43046 / CBS 188.64 / JCM 3121 / NBRC 102363 / NCIMB 12654 / NRRL B-3342 / UNCC 431) TaxID=512565 RepID=I0H250_ACTM4|nr:hypothetical protein AMIS_18670 [Actinoplanes missouriensis 431]
MILGLTWSTLTAGTIGANIGAGLATIFFLPFAACMLILAALAGVAIHKRRARRPVPTGPSPAAGPAAATPGPSTP